MKLEGDWLVELVEKLEQSGIAVKKFYFNGRLVGFIIKAKAGVHLFDLAEIIRPELLL